MVVLEVLRENKLFLNLKKCDFMTESLILLRLAISGEGISGIERKVKVVQ